MFSSAWNRPLAAIAVVSGMLVATAPAIGKTDSPKDELSGIHARDVGAGSDDVARTGDGTSTRADGIIAILIGAIDRNDDRRGQNDATLAAPQPLTAPLGSTKGSFIDGSVIDGSDARIPTGGCRPALHASRKTELAATSLGPWQRCCSSRALRCRTSARDGWSRSAPSLRPGPRTAR